MTQDSTQLLSCKYVWLLIGRIRFSSKCWCDQLVCLWRERSSHHSLDKKSGQPNHGSLRFSPHHSLGKLACLFPLPCIQSKEEKGWSASPSSGLLVTREEAATAWALCLLKAWGPCLCPARCHLFDSWDTQHWNQTVAPWWESFHITIRSRKQEVTGRGRVCSSLMLCFASVKYKYTFTHSLKPASELEHTEGHAGGPDSWHLHLDRAKFQARWFPNCLLNLLDAQIVLPRRLWLPRHYVRSRKHLIQNSGSRSRGLHISYHLLHLIVRGLIWRFITVDIV